MQKINLIASIFRKIRPLIVLAVAGCFCLQEVSAQNVAVSLHLKKASLADVFREIEKQSGYRFFYNSSVVSAKSNIDLDVTAKPVSEVLTDLFRGTEINYRVVDNYIVITTRNGNEDEQFRKLVARKGMVGGTVRNEAGEPFAGISVIEAGTVNGVVTDAAGNYSIKVAGSASVLSYSFLGYTPKQEAVGNRTTIDVALQPDDVAVEAVVVTAMGIKRQVKTLTYNVQEVLASEVTEVRDANFINSLAGKLAGVTINSSASGVGGSSRVVMRGTKSLFGSNDALYVVDGIPMPLLKTEQPSDFYKVPDHGDNDGISHLNPDDIESISVLTGSASAALYGNQGANGVVLITTKQGTPGRIRVTLTNNTSFMSPFLMPRFQNTYGQEDGSFQSWGKKLSSPSSYDPSDFFQTGYNVSNTVGVSFGGEKSSTYISAGTVNSQGVIPNTKYDRYNFMFRNTSKLLKDRMTVDLSASYIMQDDQNMRAQGQYHNPLVPIYLFPPGDDIEKYKMFERYNIDRNFPTQYWPYGNLGMGMQNPYWIVNRSMFNHERKRYMLGAVVKYELLDWLNVTGRVRIDNSEANSRKRFYASSDGIFASPAGHYMNHTSRTNQTYADVIVNLDKQLSDAFRVVANVGGSIVNTRYTLTGYEGNLLTVPNFFHYSNINRSDPDKTKAVEDGYQDQVQATFATFQLGFRNKLFLDLTGRVDWPSMLYGANQPYVFYPSIGLSGVISDMVDLRKAGISFLKLRASYSGVGNPPKRWVANKSTYEVDKGQLSMYTFPAATWLKPERTSSFEAGFNAKLFNGRLSLDATYYLSNTHNQLFEYVPAPSTGFSRMYLNAGHIRNYGVEATVGYKQNFGKVEWNSNLVFSFNRNEIKELLMEGSIDGVDFDPVTSMTVSSALNHAYEMVLTEGGTASDIYVKGLLQDSHGNIWVSSTTGEIRVDDKPIKAGSAAPDYNLGFRNSFSYKGFDLAFLLDARIGGIVVSATQSYLDGFGVSEASAEARDRGAVHINGNMPINPKNYYSVVGGGQTLAPYVYSATNVRLREVSLSYSLPAKWFNDKIGISLSLTGRNLWMIYNRAPFDPEVTASTGTYYQGFDYFMMPSTRSWGFGVKMQF